MSTANNIGNVSVSKSNTIRYFPRLKRNIITKWQLYLLCLPAVIWFIVFRYVPMYGIQIAFKDFVSTKGIWGSEWIGWDNFTRFFRSYNFFGLIKNTLGISFYQLAVGFPIPIILALMLNEVQSIRFKKTVQMVSYAPHFISTVVLIGIMNVFFQNSTSLFNILMGKLGLDAVPLMASNEWFKTMYVFSGVWQSMGWGSIIYIAALAGIDPQIQEAAVVDGATKLQKIWHINIPSIMPTAVILLILNIGRIMDVGFEKVFLMQNPLNMLSSDVIATYVYRIGIQGADFSFASAVGLFNSAINCILLVTVNAISRRMNNTSLW